MKKALSIREAQILGCIAEGLVCKEIAKQLCISERTVQTHLQRVYLKLDAKNGANAVNIAVKNRLIKQEVS